MNIPLVQWKTWGVSNGVWSRRFSSDKSCRYPKRIMWTCSFELKSEVSTFHSSYFSGVDLLILHQSNHKKIYQKKERLKMLIHFCCNHQKKKKVFCKWDLISETERMEIYVFYPVFTIFSICWTSNPSLLRVIGKNHSWNFSQSDSFSIGVLKGMLIPINFCFWINLT